MEETCFVIMPIGDQQYGDTKLKEGKLREKYDYIIKNAIQKADPALDVIRADDELNPSSISNDILTKLMYSKYVIADITYPNPNVFYELGIRHAIQTRTILIKEKIDIPTPFDISHLRYIEYTQEPSGMDKLSEQLKRRFEFYRNNPSKPDNQFLELSKFTNYKPISYGKTENDVFIDILGIFFQNPPLLAHLLNKDLTETERQQLLLGEIANNPTQYKQLMDSIGKIIKFE